MADPLWVNASGGAPAYSANELRQNMAAALQYGGRLLGARQGVRPGGDQLKVSLAGTTITVQPGVAVVDPAISTPQGPYWVALPAAENPTNGPLQAADATNPRKDIVILRVYDNDEDASGLRTARSEYIAGTAAPSPARPATPTGALRLATIDVPASGGGSAVVTDDRPYTVAAGGVTPVRDQAERDGLTGWAGMVVHRLDKGWLEIHDGSAWRIRGTVTTAALADITNPVTGQLAYLTTDGILYRYSGSAWVASTLVGGTTSATRHRGRYYQTGSGQSIPNASQQRLLLDTTEFATDDWTVSTVSGGTVFTCARAGCYQWIGHARLNGSGTGERALTMSNSGLSSIYSVQGQGTGTGGFAFSGTVMAERDFNIGDTVTLYMYQASGGAVTLDLSGSPTDMTVRWMGPKAS